LKEFNKTFEKYENEFDLNLNDNDNNKNKLNYKSWNCEDIMKWILTLEDGMFLDYCESLMEQFLFQNVKGKDLVNFDKNDLFGFGINTFSHRQSLFTHFQNLKNNINLNNN